MKKLYQKLLTLGLMSLLFFSAGNVMGQALVEEDFDYGISAGDLSTVSGGSWSPHSGAGNGPVGFTTTSLSMAGYASSGVAGSATILGASSEDISFAFTEQTTGKVYFSGLVNISAVGSGDYFFHVKDGGFGYRARIYAQTDGASGINFGIGTSGAGTYGTTSYSLNTTYLLVGTYDIATGNSDLYVLSSPTSTEPITPEASSTGTSGTSISTVSLRQGSNTPDATIDGVRVATSWSDLIPTLCTPPTTQATFAAASAIGDNGLTLNPTRGDGTAGIIILAKEGAAVDASPTSGAAYTADAAFGAGDELGTGNFVIYNGTGNGTSAAFSQAITALAIGTEYHFAAFEYNTTDVCYLTPGATATATTTGNALPEVVSVATPTAETTNELIINFSEIINATSTAGFSVTIGGVAANISNVAGATTATWTLTLAEPIQANSGAILISFDNAAGGDLADADGAPVASFTDLAVTNNTTLNVVADIESARAITPGELVQITGEVKVSFIRDNDDEIYVQDATRGIVIVDDNNVVNTLYNIGEGITGLKGTLNKGFTDVLEIIPTGDLGVASSTGATITPEVISIVELNTNFANYESRLVSLEEVGFANAGTAFDAGGDNYNIGKSGDSTIFRDNFFDFRYEGDVLIPYGRRDIVGIATQFQGEAQIVPNSTTESVLDNYAPVIDGDATPADTTTSSFKVTVSFDEPAKVQYLLNTAATATQAEVLASATMVQVDIPTDSALISLTGLDDNTQYYLHMVATDTSDANPQAVVTTVGAKTIEIIFDATSDILAADAPIAAATISAATNAEADAVDMFNFKVTDDNATDTEATTINTIVIKNNNAATWSSILAGASITDGTTATAGVITDTEITFDASAAPYVVTGGGELTFTLSAWLTSDQTDGTELSFTIPTDHAFQADAAGSVFKTTLASAVTSATHTIDVVATELAITGAPTSVQTGEVFGFSVAAEDDNGNIDTAARSLTASTAASGVLGGTTAATAMTNGVLTYADLTYDTEGIFTVAVTDGTLTGTTASITATTTITGSVFFSEYAEGSSNNKYVEIYNGTNVALDLSTVQVKQGNNGSGFDGHPDFPAAYSITLEGTLAAGDVYIIYNGQASLPEIIAEGDLALSYGDLPGDRVAAFNGDDAMGLFVDGILVDLIGDPAVDPGSGWDVAGVTGGTSNQTLVRKTSVTTGNTTALGSFGTTAEDSEWEVYDQDVVTFIGFAGELTAPTITATTANFNGDFGYVVNGASSEATSYTVSAVNLTTDLVITAPAGFELSTTTDFAAASASLTLAPVAGDVVETTVYVRFTPTTADGATYGGDITHVAAGATTINLTVSGIEGEFAISTIAEARALADGDLVKVQGTVITPDYGFNNGQYYIQDATGGVNIFHFGNQGLVNPGDLVEIEGNIAIFNSLVEIEPTGVTVISSDNALPATTSITEAGLTLDGVTQGTRVVLEGVSLVSEAEWPVAAIDAGSNLDVNALVGSTNFIINIDRGESFYDGSPVPPTTFNITGVLTRDGDNVLILPFFEGEIVETVVDPVLTVTGTDATLDFASVDAGTVSAAQSFTVAGTNLAADILVTAPAGFEVSDSEAGTYAATYTAIRDQAGEIAETAVFVRFAPAATVTGAINGDITIVSGELSESAAVTGVANEPVPTANKGTLTGVLAYPNPTQNSLIVDFAQNNEAFTYQVVSLNGTVLVSGKAATSAKIKLDGLVTGIYLLEVTQGDKVFRTRIAKK